MPKHLFLCRLRVLARGLVFLFFPPRPPRVRDGIRSGFRRVRRCEYRRFWD